MQADAIHLATGKSGSSQPSSIVIVHWNNAITNFVNENIAVPERIYHFEDSTFAPMDIPPLNQ